MKVYLKKPDKQQLKKNVFLGQYTLYSFFGRSNKIKIKKFRLASDVDDVYDVSFVDDLYFNYSFDKTRIKNYISWFRTNHGEQKVIDIVEKLKEIGFEYATKAGISLGIDDLKIPPKKKVMMWESEADLFLTKTRAETRTLTDAERYQKIIDLWHRTSEILKQNVVEHFRSTDLLNPIFMMAFSGARGNISQVRQLVGMRGLMSDPEGNVIDYSICSNFKEGLSLTEYLISCYGARKGVVDTALKTANAGYLTRRLVDVSQHVFVDIMDCNTNKGIVVENTNQGISRKLSLKKRIIGRVLAEDINQIICRNQQISKDLASQIVSLRQKVLIRSPLTCQANKSDQSFYNLTVKNQKNTDPVFLRPETDLMEKGFERRSMCQLCYGWSFNQLSLVRLGEAVGIIAGQSIGEPGTQLTMRTFHTGGVFSGEILNEIRAQHTGIIDFCEVLPGKLVRTFYGRVGFLTKISGFGYIQKDDSDGSGKSAAFYQQENTNNTLFQQNKGYESQGVQQIIEQKKGDEKTLSVSLFPKKYQEYKDNLVENTDNLKDTGLLNFFSENLEDLQNKDTNNTLGMKKTRKNSLLSFFDLPPSTIVFVRQGEKVSKNQLIAENFLNFNQVDQRNQEEYLVRPLFDGQVSLQHSYVDYKRSEQYRSCYELGYFWVLAGKLAAFYNQSEVFRSASVFREDENFPYTQFFTSLDKKNEKDFNGQIFFPKIGDLIDKTSLIKLTALPITGLTGFISNWDGFVGSGKTVFKHKKQECAKKGYDLPKKGDENWLYLSQVLAKRVAQENHIKGDGYFCSNTKGYNLDLVSYKNTKKGQQQQKRDGWKEIEQKTGIQSFFFPSLFSKDTESERDSNKLRIFSLFTEKDRQGKGMLTKNFTNHFYQKPLNFAEKKQKDYTQKTDDILRLGAAQYSQVKDGIPGFLGKKDGIPSQASINKKNAEKSVFQKALRIKGKDFTLKNKNKSPYQIYEEHDKKLLKAKELHNQGNHLVVNQPILKNFFKNIQFSNIGYFWAESSRKKNTNNCIYPSYPSPCLKTHTLYSVPHIEYPERSTGVPGYRGIGVRGTEELKNSLFTNKNDQFFIYNPFSNNSTKNLVYKWFPEKYKTSIGGFILFDKYYYNPQNQGCANRIPSLARVPSQGCANKLARVPSQGLARKFTQDKGDIKLFLSQQQKGNYSQIFWVPESCYQLGVLTFKKVGSAKDKSQKKDTKRRIPCKGILPFVRSKQGVLFSHLKKYKGDNLYNKYKGYKGVSLYKGYKKYVSCKEGVLNWLYFFQRPYSLSEILESRKSKQELRKLGTENKIKGYPKVATKIAKGYVKEDSRKDIREGALWDTPCWNKESFLLLRARKSYKGIHLALWFLFSRFLKGIRQKYKFEEILTIDKNFSIPIKETYKKNFTHTKKKKNKTRDTKLSLKKAKLAHSVSLKKKANKKKTEKTTPGIRSKQNTKTKNKKMLVESKKGPLKESKMGRKKKKDKQDTPLEESKKNKNQQLKSVFLKSIPKKEKKTKKKTTKRDVPAISLGLRVKKKDTYSLTCFNKGIPLLKQSKQKDTVYAYPFAKKIRGIPKLGKSKLNPFSLFSCAYPFFLPTRKYPKVGTLPSIPVVSFGRDVSLPLRVKEDSRKKTRKGARFYKGYKDEKTGCSKKGTDSKFDMLKQKRDIKHSLLYPFSIPSLHDRRLDCASYQFFYLSDIYKKSPVFYKINLQGKMSEEFSKTDGYCLVFEKRLQKRDSLGYIPHKQESASQKRMLFLFQQQEKNISIQKNIPLQGIRALQVSFLKTNFGLLIKQIKNQQKKKKYDVSTKQSFQQSMYPFLCKGILPRELSIPFFGSKYPFVSLFLRARKSYKGIKLVLSQLWDTPYLFCESFLLLRASSIPSLANSQFWDRNKEGIRASRIPSLANSQHPLKNTKNKKQKTKNYKISTYSFGVISFREIVSPYTSYPFLLGGLGRVSFRRKIFKKMGRMSKSGKGLISFRGSVFAPLTLYPTKGKDTTSRIFFANPFFFYAQAKKESILLRRDKDRYFSLLFQSKVQEKVNLSKGVGTKIAISLPLRVKEDDTSKEYGVLSLFSGYGVISFQDNIFVPFIPIKYLKGYKNTNFYPKTKTIQNFTYYPLSLGMRSKYPEEVPEYWGTGISGYWDTYLFEVLWSWGKKILPLTPKGYIDTTLYPFTPKGYWVLGYCGTETQEIQGRIPPGVEYVEENAILVIIPERANCSFFAFNSYRNQKTPSLRDKRKYSVRRDTRKQRDIASFVPTRDTRDTTHTRDTPFTRDTKDTRDTYFPIAQKFQYLKAYCWKKNSKKRKSHNLFASQILSRTPLGDLCDFKMYICNYSNQYNFSKKNKKLQTNSESILCELSLPFFGSLLLRASSIPSLALCQQKDTELLAKKTRYSIWDTFFYNSLFYLTRKKKKKLVQNFEKSCCLLFNHNHSFRTTSKGILPCKEILPSIAKKTNQKFSISQQVKGDSLLLREKKYAQKSTSIEKFKSYDAHKKKEINKDAQASLRSKDAQASLRSKDEQASLRSKDAQASLRVSLRKDAQASLRVSLRKDGILSQAKGYGYFCSNSKRDTRDTEWLFAQGKGFAQASKISSNSTFFLSKYLLIHLKNQKTTKKRYKIQNFSINQTSCQILYKEGWVYSPTSKSLKNHQSFLPAAGRNQSLVDNLCFDQVPVFLEYILNNKKDLKRYAKFFKNESYLTRNWGEKESCFKKNKKQYLKFKLGFCSANQYNVYLPISFSLFGIRKRVDTKERDTFFFVPTPQILSPLTQDFFGSRFLRASQKRDSLGYISLSFPNFFFLLGAIYSKSFLLKPFYTKKSKIFNRDKNHLFDGFLSTFVFVNNNSFCIKNKSTKISHKRYFFPLKPKIKPPFSHLNETSQGIPTVYFQRNKKQKKGDQGRQNNFCLLIRKVSQYSLLPSKDYKKRLYSSYPFDFNKNLKKHGVSLHTSHLSCEPNGYKREWYSIWDIPKFFKDSKNLKSGSGFLQDTKDYPENIVYTSIPSKGVDFYAQENHIKGYRYFSANFGIPLVGTKKGYAQGVSFCLRTLYKVEREPQKRYGVTRGIPFLEFIKSDINNCNQKFNKQFSTNKNFSLDKFNPENGKFIHPDYRIEDFQSEMKKIFLVFLVDPNLLKADFIKTFSDFTTRSSVLRLSSFSLRLFRLIIDWLILEIGYISDLQIHQQIRFSNTPFLQKKETNKGYPVKNLKKNYENLDENYCVSKEKTTTRNENLIGNVNDFSNFVIKLNKKKNYYAKKEKTTRFLDYFYKFFSNKPFSYFSDFLNSEKNIKRAKKDGLRVKIIKRRPRSVDPFFVPTRGIPKLPQSKKKGFVPTAKGIRDIPKFPQSKGKGFVPTAKDTYSFRKRDPFVGTKIAKDIRSNSKRDTDFLNENFKNIAEYTSSYEPFSLSKSRDMYPLACESSSLTKKLDCWNHKIFCFKQIQLNTLLIKSQLFEKKYTDNILLNYLERVFINIIEIYTREAKKLKKLKENEKIRKIRNEKMDVELICRLLIRCRLSLKKDKKNVLLKYQQKLYTNLLGIYTIISHTRFLFEKRKKIRNKKITKNKKRKDAQAVSLPLRVSLRKDAQFVRIPSKRYVSLGRDRLRVSRKKGYETSKKGVSLIKGVYLYKGVSLYKRVSLYKGKDNKKGIRRVFRKKGYDTYKEKRYLSNSANQAIQTLEKISKSLTVFLSVYVFSNPLSQIWVKNKIQLSFVSLQNAAKIRESRDTKNTRESSSFKTKKKDFLAQPFICPNQSFHFCFRRLVNLDFFSLNSTTNQNVFLNFKNENHSDTRKPSSFAIFVPTLGYPLLEQKRDTRKPYPFSCFVGTPFKETGFVDQKQKSLMRKKIIAKEGIDTACFVPTARIYPFSETSKEKNAPYLSLPLYPFIKPDLPGILTKKIICLITDKQFWYSYSKENPLTLTLFFSPYNGEVIENLSTQQQKQHKYPFLGYGAHISKKDSVFQKGRQYCFDPIDSLKIDKIVKELTEKDDTDHINYIDDTDNIDYTDDIDYTNHIDETGDIDYTDHIDETDDETIFKTVPQRRDINTPKTGDLVNALMQSLFHYNTESCLNFVTCIFQKESIRQPLVPLITQKCFVLDPQEYKFFSLQKEIPKKVSKDYNYWFLKQQIPEIKNQLEKGFQLPYSPYFYLGNKNCLLLTKNEKLTLNSEQPKPEMTIGQLFHPGETLTEHLCIPFSGQIIEIEKNKVKIRRAQNVTTSSRGKINVKTGDFVDTNYALLTLYYQKLTTDDIIQGIPKIEQLFEARRTKEGLPFDGNLPDYLDDLFFLEMKKHNYKPKQAAENSFAQIQRILIDKIQDVYISQGVIIPDKHLEIVVRQMTEKVVIVDNGWYGQSFSTGKTWFLPGEFVALDVADGASLLDSQVYLKKKKKNRKIAKGYGLRVKKERIPSSNKRIPKVRITQAKRYASFLSKPRNPFKPYPLFSLPTPLTYKPILLGVTTASLECESFFSAASFQETTRILSGSAIKGQKDFLHGLKERVILGDYINVGTGSLNFNVVERFHLSLPLTRDFLNIIQQIETEKARQTNILVHIFGEREIIVDQIFQILAPISYLEETLKQPFQELENTLKQPFQNSPFLSLTPKKNHPIPDTQYPEGVQGYRGTGVLGYEQSFSGSLLNQLFQEKGKKVEKTFKEILEFKSRYNFLEFKKRKVRVDSSKKKVKKTPQSKQKDTPCAYPFKLPYPKVGTKIAKEYVRRDSNSKVDFWDPYWDPDPKKVKERWEKERWEKQTQRREKCCEKFSKILNHFFYQQLSPLFFQPIPTEAQTRANQKKFKFYQSLFLFSEIEEWKDKKKGKKSQLKGYASKHKQGCASQKISLYLSQHKVSFLPYLGYGDLPDAGTPEKKKKQPNKGYVKQQKKSFLPIDEEKVYQQYFPEPRKPLFQKKSFFFAQPQQLLQMVDKTIYSCIKPTTINEDAQVKGRSKNAQKEGIQGIRTVSLFSGYKKDSFLGSNSKNTLPKESKSLLPPPFFEIDTNNNSIKEFRRIPFTEKQKIEKKVEQILLKVENVFYEEYKFDFYRFKEKSFKKSRFFSLLQYPEKVRGTEYKILPFQILPFWGNQLPIFLRYRVNNRFYEEYKSKIEDKILNSILFTYNHQFRDFSEMKKTGFKQKALKPYFLSPKRDFPSIIAQTKTDTKETKKGSKDAQANKGKEDVSQKFPSETFFLRITDMQSTDTQSKDTKKGDDMVCTNTQSKDAKRQQLEEDRTRFLSSEYKIRSLKNYEIDLEHVSYIPNQFAQIIAYIYKKIGLIPYLSSKLKNIDKKSLPDTFRVDPITGKIYININEIYLKYLIDYFYETKSSVLKSVIIFCFLEKYEKKVKTVSNSLYFLFCINIFYELRYDIYVRRCKGKDIKPVRVWKRRYSSILDSDL